MSEKVLFIAGNVPSSKNSNQIGKYGLFKSKTVNKYLQNLGVAKYSSSKKIYSNYKTRPNKFELLRPQFLDMIQDKSYPLNIGFYFIRDSARSFDYTNISQILLDLMTAHNFIPDDCMKYVKPVFVGYEINKDKPGVIISIF